MNISPADLGAQYDRAATAWPFVQDVEGAHHLPAMLLFAVGSRETNLTDETGDGGHGRGVWQLDDRSHQIPNPFPVVQQAGVAAGMLADNFRRFGSWEAACNAYNSGSPSTDATTGHDYGPDVLERMAWLQANRAAAPTFDDQEVAAWLACS